MTHFLPVFNNDVIWKIWIFPSVFRSSNHVLGSLGQFQVLSFSCSAIFFSYHCKFDSFQKWRYLKRYLYVHSPRLSSFNFFSLSYSVLLFSFLLIFAVSIVTWLVNRSINFESTSTHLGLFYVKRFGNPFIEHILIFLCIILRLFK